MAKVAETDIERLRTAIDALVRAFKITEGHRQEDASQSLSATDVQALLFVGRNPDCIAQDVANFLGIVPTTNSAVLDRLVKRGLLQRARTEENRRVVRLTVTEAGARRIEAIVAEQNAHCAAMLRRLDTDERKAFLAAITKIASSPA